MIKSQGRRKTLSCRLSDGGLSEPQIYSLETTYLYDSSKLLSSWSDGKEATPDM